MLIATNSSKEITQFLTQDKSQLLSETGRGSDVPSYSDSCATCLKGTQDTKRQQELSEATALDAPLVKNETGWEGTEISRGFTLT